jgi:hypothetical protein
VVLVDEVGVNNVLPPLPSLGNYDFNRFDSTPNQTAASRALDKIKEKYYPDMVKVSFGLTKEMKDNYAKLLTHEVPDYYYRNDKGTLSYYELEVVENQGGISEMKHRIYFSDLGAEYDFYKIDDATGEVE